MIYVMIMILKLCTKPISARYKSIKGKKYEVFPRSAKRPKKPRSGDIIIKRAETLLPGSMKTPKTLLTNLMKTHVWGLALANQDVFAHWFSFFFFGKRNEQ